MSAVLDDLFAPPVAESKPDVKKVVVDPQRGRHLYFDLETIPDESREHLFDLPPLPQMPTRRAMADCMPVADLIEGDIPAIKQYLPQANPCDEFLSALEAAERQEKKPRKGVLDAIADYRTSLLAVGSAAEERRKVMSITPEFCRIAAMGWTIDGGPTRSMVIGECISEEAILEQFWQLAANCNVLVGFNVLGFDLPVVFVRSAILGIDPTRKIDTSPFKTDVCDLMARRWPKGGAKGLKVTAKLLGIDVPAGDVDGSQVYDLLQSDPLKVACYVSSDVNVTRSLHERFQGLFW